jgi:hypothetical protein
MADRIYGWIRVIVIGLVAGYALIALAITLWQRSLLYFPLRSHPPLTPGFAEVSLDSAAGRLLAWYRPAAAGRPTIVFFDGNGGSLPDAAVFTEPLGRLGYGLLLASYPGYDGNPGRPTEAASIRPDAPTSPGWPATASGRRSSSVIRSARASPCKWPRRATAAP